jgi:hypothetical protein
MHFPTHAVLHALPMHLPTHACLHARKPHCIVIRGPVPLAAIVEACNCGGRLGSFHGLVVGPSHDNTIAAAHAICLVSSPLLHPLCRLHHHWRLPSPDAVATRWRTWRCCTHLVYAHGFVAYLASCHGDLAFGGPAGVALVPFPALHWCPCPQCAGVIASVALSLSPVLPRRHHPRSMGVFALVALAL